MDSCPLVLRNFSGVPEITPDAFKLKKKALVLSCPIKKVETQEEQSLAVQALRELREISKGMESTRKAVKAPVVSLGKKIDSIAADFLEEIEREELRIEGHINHFQREQIRLKEKEQRDAEEAIRRAEELQKEAEALKKEAEKSGRQDLMEVAVELEKEALDKELTHELSSVPVASKPKGLVVKERLNFQILDAIVFCQAYPQFFSWNADTEVLKLKRREILEELNREDEKGCFHVSRFPEELPLEGSRVAKPPGMRIFEEIRSHVR